MLNWTCPECGRECSPLLRDCPACPPPSGSRSQLAVTDQNQSTANGGILALAQNLETIHAFPLLTSIPERRLLAANGQSGCPAVTASATATLDSSSVTAPTAEAMIVLAEETLAIPVRQTVDYLVRPLVESAELVSGVGAVKEVQPAQEAVPAPQVEPASGLELGRELDTAPIIATQESETVRDAEVLADLPLAQGVQAELAFEPLIQQSTTAPISEPATAEPTAPAVQADPQAVSDALIQLALEEFTLSGMDTAQQSITAPISDTPTVEPTIAVVQTDLPTVAGTPAELTPGELTVSSIEATQPSMTAPIWDTPTVEPTIAVVQTDLPTVAGTQAELTPGELTVSSIEATQPSMTAPISDTPIAEPTIALVQTDLPAVAGTPAELTPGELTVSSMEATQPSMTAPISETPTAEPAAPAIQADPQAVSEALAQLALEQFILLGMEPAQQPMTAPLSDSASLEPTDVEARIDSQAVASAPAELVSEDIAGSSSPIADTTTSTPTVTEALPSTTDLEVSAAIEALSRALELQSDTVLQGISALFAAKQSAIQAIMASFELRPTANLLNAPAQVVIAPAPPAEWVRMSRPVIAPRLPSVPRLDAQIAAPQAVTLAGPCLPPQLRNLTEARDLSDKRNRKAIGFPAWVVSVGVAMSLFLCTGTLLQYINVKRETPAAEAPDPPAPQQPKRAAMAPAAASDALARSLEVSGLRLVAGWTSKPQVQFLIINHSSRQLPSVAIQVAVRSSESSDDSQPLLTINAVIHSLGPYQSKEIRADLDSDASPSTLADWQSLRTQIQSARRE
jgi:hypothetical protein